MCPRIEAQACETRQGQTEPRSSPEQLGRRRQCPEHGVAAPGQWGLQEFIWGHISEQRSCEGPKGLFWTPPQRGALRYCSGEHLHTPQLLVPFQLPLPLGAGPPRPPFPGALRPSPPTFPKPRLQPRASLWAGLSPRHAHGNRLQPFRKFLSPKGSCRRCQPGAGCGRGLAATPAPGPCRPPAAARSCRGSARNGNEPRASRSHFVLGKRQQGCRCPKRRENSAQTGNFPSQTKCVSPQCSARPGAVPCALPSIPEHPGPTASVQGNGPALFTATSRKKQGSDWKGHCCTFHGQAGWGVAAQEPPSLLPFPGCSLSARPSHPSVSFSLQTGRG